MLGAEAAYTQMEADLQYELDHYEALHPGYDEYHFDLDEITHDPYVLISLLTAYHEGEWTLSEVQSTLFYPCCGPAGQSVAQRGTVQSLLCRA